MPFCGPFGAEVGENVTWRAFPPPEWGSQRQNPVFFCAFLMALGVGLRVGLWGRLGGWPARFCSGASTHFCLFGLALDARFVAAGRGLTPGTPRGCPFMFVYVRLCSFVLALCSFVFILVFACARLVAIICCNIVLEIIGDFGHLHAAHQFVHPACA